MIMPPGYSGLYDPPVTRMKQTRDIHFFLTYKSRISLNTKQHALPKQIPHFRHKHAGDGMGSL